MIHRNLHASENELSDLLLSGNFAGDDSAVFWKRLVSGRYPDSSARAFFVLLSAFGESPDALIAAWKAIRQAEQTAVSFDGPCLDTCGTGGDASHSINLSTLSSVVMAAAGVCVLKHGNRAITSRCGSSDLLDAFGFNLNQKIESVLDSARKVNMGYFHAPAVHPVYARYQALRRGMRVRTLFNLLGPVLNPVAVRYQLLGTAESRLLHLYQTLLPSLGRERALIFMGADGMDEITSLGLTRGVLLRGNKAQNWLLNPVTLGFRKGKKSELQIQSVAHAKKRAIDILKLKKSGAARDSVILSAAAGISVFDGNANLADAVSRAKNAIDSGKSWIVLNEMVRVSKL